MKGKRRKLKTLIWLMYFLYKNKTRIFKPVEITIKEFKGTKEKNRGDEPIQVIMHMCMEMSQ
jgi:hypothetical protein